jgi:hypothetical protein
MNTNKESLPTQEVISLFDNEIRAIYVKEDLRSLWGENADFMYNGKQLLSWYHKTVLKGKIAFEGEFDFRMAFDDLVFCADEVVYLIAQMYLYRPFLNSPLRDGHLFGEGWLFPNRQNVEAKRYSFCANTACEKIYNFWDRIGDIIAAYFSELIKPRDVYFPLMIDRIPEEFHGCAGFQWLDNFKKNEYSELNGLRKQVVHYKSVDTEMKHEHFEGSRNREKMAQWEQKRTDKADYYKSQLPIMLDGVVNMILFIEEINRQKLVHIS